MLIHPLTIEQTEKSVEGKGSYIFAPNQKKQLLLSNRRANLGGLVIS